VQNFRAKILERTLAASACPDPDSSADFAFIRARAIKRMTSFVEQWFHTNRFPAYLPDFLAQGLDKPDVQALADAKGMFAPPLFPAAIA
jgi:hypothetical protein